MTLVEVIVAYLEDHTIKELMHEVLKAIDLSKRTR
jgi:hypothetical protein